MSMQIVVVHVWRMCDNGPAFLRNLMRNRDAALARIRALSCLKDVYTKVCADHRNDDHLYVKS